MSTDTAPREIDYDLQSRMLHELEPVVEGTRVRVVESSPEFGPALELRSFAWTALAAA